MTIERRTLIQAVAGGALLLPQARAQAQDRPPSAQPAAGQRPWHDLGLLPNPVMNSQLLHVLGATYSGQGDIGEVLDTATRIDPADEWSWATQWVATAERVAAMGEASLQKGHKISAGKAFLRAATYYRAALLHHPDPAHASNLESARKAVDAQTRAYQLLNVPAREVKVRYEHGYCRAIS